MVRHNPEKAIDEVLNLGLKDNLQYNINQSQIAKNQFLVKETTNFPKREFL
jgi:cobalt-zinc-cadmium resistance protein CzcA